MSARQSIEERRAAFERGVKASAERMKAEALVSHATTETRHPTGGWMTCGACGDKRRMIIFRGVYRCRKCRQLWKYPPAQ